MAFWGGGRLKLDGGLPGDDDAGVAQAASSVYNVLSESLVELGLQIVREGRGPMRLWDFSWRLGLRLGMPPMPLGELSDAVKSTLASIGDPRLRLLAPPTRGTGAGYVYDAADPDAAPVRSGR
jgi:hypothetical protein